MKRKLVEDPAQWRWSSSRYYAFAEEGPVKLKVVLLTGWKKPRQKRDD